MAIATPRSIIEINGRRLPNVLSYTLKSDIRELTDSLTFSASPSEYHNLIKDTEVKFRFNVVGNEQFTGRLAKRVPTDDGAIDVSCYDRTFTWNKESIQPSAGFNIGSGNLSREILRIVSPDFRNVVFSNAADRSLKRQSTRGQSRTISEPLTNRQLKAIRSRLRRGTSRSSALEQILVPLGLLAWSSGDGKTLIIAKPNYAQLTQYRFIKTPSETNVLAMTYSDSIESRVSEIEYTGSARGSGVSRPVNITGVTGKASVVTYSQGKVVDNTGDFLVPVKLVVSSTNSSPDEARARAARLLGMQIGKAKPVRVVVPGYGQEINGGTVLYASDTIATVKLSLSDFKSDNEIPVLNESYYIVSVQFSNANGPRTEMELIPVGTPLV